MQRCFIASMLHGCCLTVNPPDNTLSNCITLLHIRQFPKQCTKLGNVDAIISMMSDIDVVLEPACHGHQPGEHPLLISRAC